MDLREQKTGRFEATILFCDIRGFTSLFDQRDPLDALHFANSVLAKLGGAVEESYGTLDKFTGDGFLAHFGITYQDPDHAMHACECVVKMRKLLGGINSARYIEDSPVVSVGVGIHSGVVAAGTISTKNKTEYTVLGSSVNLASRIEGLTKFFGLDCLLSEQTANLVRGKFELQDLPAREVRGVKGLVSTAWLMPSN